MKLTPFGALVRQLRMQRGIYMQAMADQLGVSESFLSGVEFGRHEVPDDWPEKIAAMIAACERQEPVLVEALSALLDASEIYAMPYPVKQRARAVLARVEAASERAALAKESCNE